MKKNVLMMWIIIEMDPPIAKIPDVVMPVVKGEKNASTKKTIIEMASPIVKTPTVRKNVEKEGRMKIRMNV